MLTAIAWTAAACTRNSYIPPHPDTKSYYTFFVRSAQGESSGNSGEELAADSEKVAADGPMGHRRLCKDFGWGSGAVLFAKSSFREISQANRESTRILARLLFAKSSFDEYFKQKRESTAAAPKEFIFYFSKLKFFREISGLYSRKPTLGGDAIFQDSR
ncbi:MAG: hypothetical protein ACLRTA_08480 [Clostridia bacterium]